MLASLSKHHHVQDILRAAGAQTTDDVPHSSAALFPSYVGDDDEADCDCEDEDEDEVDDDDGGANEIGDHDECGYEYGDEDYADEEVEESSEDSE